MMKLNLQQTLFVQDDVNSINRLRERVSLCYVNSGFLRVVNDIYHLWYFPRFQQRRHLSFIRGRIRTNCTPFRKQNKIDLFHWEKKFLMSSTSLEHLLFSLVKSESLGFLSGYILNCLTHHSAFQLLCPLPHLRWMVIVVR